MIKCEFIARYNWDTVLVNVLVEKFIKDNNIVKEQIISINFPNPDTCLITYESI